MLKVTCFLDARVAGPHAPGSLGFVPQRPENYTQSQDSGSFYGLQPKQPP